MGHVQSGKTANFTSVIAKAIDACCKRVIVLTGTVELLREQTQRRLDMELIGEENILGGITRDNPELAASVDYIRSGAQLTSFLESVNRGLTTTHSGADSVPLSGSRPARTQGERDFPAQPRSRPPPSNPRGQPATHPGDARSEPRSGQTADPTYDIPQLDPAIWGS
ncbi:MAG: hypothetical protein WAS07_08575 [Micropruina sp.]